MGNKDFNTFMDSYIDDIRSNKPMPFSTKKKKEFEQDTVPEEVSADSVYVIKKPKTWWQNVCQMFSSTDEEDFEEKPKEEKKATTESEQEFEQEYQEIEHEEKHEGFFAKLLSIFSRKENETYEDIDDQEKVEKQEEIPSATKVYTEELPEEPQKPSFFKRILHFIGLDIEYEDAPEDNDEVQEQAKPDPTTEKMIELKEEMKELAVISTAVMKKLPKEQFELFKNSADFQNFKKILKKHNIIKETENTEK